MRELVNDPFYRLIEGYRNCVIDYCLIVDDVPHRGQRSHRDAILFAMLKVMERYMESERRDALRYGGEVPDAPFSWSVDMEKARGHRIDPAELLSVPDDLRRDRTGRWICDREPPDPLKGEQIPYWYAFWLTPHISGYGPEDFRAVNAALFPLGTDGLEVYEWTTDWSDYFDDGREWWGTACWSVYDARMNRYAVILAATTD